MLSRRYPDNRRECRLFSGSFSRSVRQLFVGVDGGGGSGWGGGGVEVVGGGGRISHCSLCQYCGS